jgi:hypothetical protein
MMQDNVQVSKSKNSLLYRYIYCLLSLSSTIERYKEELNHSFNRCSLKSFNNYRSSAIYCTCNERCNQLKAYVMILSLFPRRYFAWLK